MRPLRLAYLLPNLRAGGAERQVLALAARLPRDRFQADFLALIGSGPLDHQAKSAGISIRHVGSRPLHQSPLVTRALGRSGKILTYARIARHEHYDIIDAWIYPADVIAALTRIATRTSVVISGSRNLDVHRGLGPLGGMIDRVVNRVTDAVVANSAAAAAFAERSHRVSPAKLRIIRNGVELIEPLSEPERLGLRQALGATSHDLVLGCVANFNEVKRHELLINAFAELARNRSHLRLVLVGDGTLRAAIERQITSLGLESKVRVHGTAVNTGALYSAFDVLVHASRSEGMPNVLLEGAAAGLPIVATAAGGSGEIVLDGQTGLLVPIEDEGALVEAMTRVVDDEDLRVRLGASARHHVANTFGMDRFVREFSDLYEELAVAKHVPR